MNIALSIIDIDDFKSVNDNFGHLFGDKVIKAVANVIKNAVGTSGVAGRIGGDEFFIVFEKLNNELEYRNVLRCIKTNVAIQYQDQMERKLSCSMVLHATASDLFLQPTMIYLRLRTALFISQR